MIWTRLIFVFGFFKPLLFAAEGVSLEYHQYCCIDYYLNEFLPNTCGSIVLLGVVESTIEEISKRHPSIEMVALDFRDKKSWPTIIKKQGWENKFDCTLAMNILERDTDREGLVRLVYDLLKPGGRGVIYIDSPEVDSFDGRIENFIKKSKWNESIQVVSGLPIPEYREIIEKSGFYIVHEHDVTFRLHYLSALDFERSAGNWICNRLDIPFPYREAFVLDFGESLPTLWGQLWHPFPGVSFVIEKP